MRSRSQTILVLVSFKMAALVRIQPHEFCEVIKFVSYFASDSMLFVSVITTLLIFILFSCTLKSAMLPTIAEALTVVIQHIHMRTLILCSQRESKFYKCFVQKMLLVPILSFPLSYKYETLQI